MNDQLKLEYSNRELVQLILRDKGIHDGFWVLQARFSFAAMNISPTVDIKDGSPAGVVMLSALRIERVLEQTPISVNAAEANPAHK